ncbi:MAG: ribonuclease J [Clostridia bacterium]|nr:ribonuclease J [Clostridia bacterium]MCI8944309.1 ribonuclease J [Clostridia bacterium]MCI9290823.1 ribonuclease J [Clostridia bacterium]
MARQHKQLEVAFLGGVGEIGKNMTALQFGNDIIIVDCGSTFPSVDDTPGIDLIVPDFAFIKANIEKVKGILITHGHEDHIGGIPHLLSECGNIPIYGSSLAIALIKHKLTERKINMPKMHVVKNGDVKKVGAFSVEFVSVSHSILGAFALAITYPDGVVFHTGDYKIDYTPVDGDGIDLNRIAAIGNKGVTLMLGESTNVEKRGSTISEKEVGMTLERVIDSHPDNRIIIATFASNVNRVQQIIRICEKVGRKVAFDGRSMVKISEIARELGMLEYSDNTVIDIEDIKGIEPHRLCIISTGSQGEPMSALTRMANGEDKSVVITDSDVVAISSQPIPGNEKAVYTLINNLYRRGAKVLYGSLEQLHVSGHACQDELKTMLTLVNPKYFVPVHGEYRHLKKHEELALSLGIDKKNILLADIGTRIAVKKKSVQFIDSVEAGEVYVDGNSSVDSLVIRDRKQLSSDGVLIALLNIDVENRALVSIDILTRGVVFDDEFLEKMKSVIDDVFASSSYKDEKSRGGLKNNIKRKLERMILNKHKQRPMILPLLIEQSKSEKEEEEEV